MLPEEVLITTFTVKAAAELRSRLIEWGIAFHEKLAADHSSGQGKAFFEAIDINRFATGTLDAICEEWLRDSRMPGEVTPVLIEGFAANQVLSRQIVYAKYATSEAALRAFLARYTFDGRAPLTRGATIKTLRPLLDRLVHDRVDLAAYANGAGSDKAARKLIADVLTDYHAYLRGTSQCDFGLLEATYLERLENGRLDGKALATKAILVDEYQDTNPLQEAIYFALVKRSGGALTVVGDDDQGLYRFRGATVELFRDFKKRYRSAIGASPTSEYLTDNYRSVPEVITFFNTYIKNDADFAGARVKPLKPAINPTRSSIGPALLGMFRDDAEGLADDLAKFLDQLFNGGTVTIATSTGNVALHPGKGGALGDAVLLGRSVQEMSSPFMGNPGTVRFPHHLRERLSARGMGMFNPRGRALRDIESVQVLMGLALDCLDPDDDLASTQFLTNTVKDYLAEWQQASAAFMSTNPKPHKGRSLKSFVKDWKSRTPAPGDKWPREWPLLELVYTLVTWMPEFQSDPEHQVYLEAITRAIAQAASFSKYRSKIAFIDPHYDNSRKSLLFDVFSPLAEDLIEVDEDILTAVPRDRLNVMTIHQAKGLEFPLVIVDVGSQLKSNHRMHAFTRFPVAPSATQYMEDDVGPYSNVGALRGTRSGLQRSFEDLIRLYYVAYSRPQTMLLLVGLTKCIEYTTSVKHVGLFWGSDGTWTWQGKYPGKRPPPIVNNHPFAALI
jgi:DNA helicase-2/ATP-dependent DNA helicase PcrA